MRTVFRWAAGFDPAQRLRGRVLEQHAQLVILENFFGQQPVIAHAFFNDAYGGLVPFQLVPDGEGSLRRKKEEHLFIEVDKKYGEDKVIPPWFVILWKAYFCS